MTSAVRQFAVASTVPPPRQRNTADYVFENAGRRPAHVALRRRVGPGWADVTCAQFAAEVTGVARGLIASGIGLGDRVAVMSRTRYEWTVVDFALFCVGAVVVPIYETSSAEQVEWILRDSGARAAFVEHAGHAATIGSVRDRTPGLDRVWQFDAAALDELAAAGAGVEESAVHERRAAVRLDDLASIIYTSGTTGRPKGCTLTHRCFVSEVNELADSLAEIFNETTSTLLFLPIAHVFGRAIHIGAVAVGCALGHTGDIADLLDDLGTFRPTFVLAVPRVFEKVYNGARQKARAAGKGAIFDRAESVAIAYSRATEPGVGPAAAPSTAPLALRVGHAIFDRLVYRKLRAAMGGRCVAAVSGGAPLGERLGHFFRGVGVTVYEGYGLTETTAGITINRPTALRIGTVGRPIGGASVHVADDGELLFTSPVVFTGYWNDDAATAEAFDPQGRFRTGDLGEVDADGFVRITGRKKELIVTANGKNVAPAQLEDRVRAHWLVDQCLVVGDQRPFVAALITLDAEAFAAWLDQHGVSSATTVAEAVGDPRLRAEIQAAVDAANQAVSRAESIRKFTILPGDWTQEGGQITPSLKLKRAVVLRECGAEIDALYAAPAPA